MGWRILTEEEHAQLAVRWEREAAEEAERARIIEECRQEREHEWVLELPEATEDYAGVDLRCLHCPAGIDDVYPDGQDMIYLEHGDVKVNAGYHNSPEPLTIPVTVSVVTGKIWTDYGLEYDTELVIESRDAAEGDRMKEHGDLDWRKSSRSIESHCVEVAPIEDSILVRNSNDPQGPVLQFTRDEWLPFIDGVKDGEFDFNLDAT